MRMREQEVEDLKAKLTMLEKEQKALIDRTRSLNETVDNKSVQIEKTQVKLDGVTRDVHTLSHQIQALDVDINEVERSNARHLDH